MLYHRICQGGPYTEGAEYKKDVMCPISLNIENGTTPHLNYYYTFDDRLPAYITEPVVGTQLKIICDQGYIADNSFAECSVINQKPIWNPTPTCRRIGCFGMPDPENGISHCNENIVDNGTMCNVTCKQGYTASEDYTQCLEGNFTKEITCKKQIIKEPKGTAALIGGIVGGIVGIIIIIVILVFLCRRYELWKKFWKQVRPQQIGHLNGVAGQGNQHGPEARNGHVNGNGNVEYNGLYVRLPDNGTRIPSNPDPRADFSISISSIQGPPSNISPESRSSSIVSVPTETVILTPITPSDVLSSDVQSLDVQSPDVQSPDEDGEHTPLMRVLVDDDQPTFILDNNSAVRPMEASFASPTPESQNLSSSDVGSNTMHHSSNPSLDCKAASTSAGIDTEQKTPVENEDIQDEEVKSDQPKQPVEHEDESNFQTLGSTGSDLIDMVRGCDATNPKEFFEDDETNPKALREVPETDTDRSEQNAETLQSNPTLSDFGLTRTDSEKKDRKAMGELGLPTNRSYDAAYGSGEPSTLDSNPKPLIMKEEVPVVIKVEEDDQTHQEALREFPETDTEPNAETLESNPNLVDYCITGIDSGDDTGRGTMYNLDDSIENIDDFAQ